MGGLREWRIRNGPMLMTAALVACGIAGALLLYGAALAIKWAVSGVLPITGGRIADAVLWQGMASWMLAGVLVAVAQQFVSVDGDRS